MCFTPAMSLYLALSAMSISGYLIFSAKTWRQIHPMVIPFLFYMKMEFLQLAQHSFLDQCGAFWNFHLTIFAHVLVVLQPLLWNFYRWIRARNKQEEAVFKLAMLMSVIWAVFFTFRLIPRSMSRGIFPRGALSKTLNKSEVMVGTEICTRSGPVHLYWTLPYLASGGSEPNFWAYLLLWFVPAIYENHGYIKLAYWIAQVAVANWTAEIIHEIPTLWCLSSTIVLVLILFLDRERARSKNE